MPARALFLGHGHGTCWLVAQARWPPLGSLPSVPPSTLAHLGYPPVTSSLAQIIGKLSANAK